MPKISQRYGGFSPSVCFSLQKLCSSQLQGSRRRAKSSFAPSRTSCQLVHTFFSQSQGNPPLLVKRQQWLLNPAGAEQFSHMKKYAGICREGSAKNLGSSHKTELTQTSRSQEMCARRRSAHDWTVCGLVPTETQPLTNPL